ncbi:uncharacterized protein [Typha angustifolia]|uniref:uncharacterized protein n=1 Tax=Typha angustifolia TaxID=59011 RepID=UPI003C2E1674
MLFFSTLSSEEHRHSPMQIQASMSPIAGLPSINKPSHHHRNDSFELEIFDAKRYFSGGTDDFALINSFKPRKEEEPPKTTTKRSFDLRIKEKEKEKEKKCKQPSSPGVRLAGFLNSFFNQAVSRKKSTSTKRSTMEDNKEGRFLCGRSSINSSRSTRLTDAKAIYSCESGDFRASFLYPSTPSELGEEKGSTTDHDEYVGKKWALNKKSELTPWRSWKSSRRNEQEEAGDGWESDSSSDLFELKNYDSEPFKRSRNRRHSVNN